MGNYLKQKLEEKNMSQKELAIRCNVAQSTISRYCNNKNKRNMDLDLACSIGQILGLNLLDLKNFKGDFNNG